MTLHIQHTVLVLSIYCWSLLVFAPRCVGFLHHQQPSFGIRSSPRDDRFISPARTITFNIQRTAISESATATDSSGPSSSDSDQSSSSSQMDSVAGPVVIRSPLKYYGGVFPCIGLTFPDLSTSAQRQRNVSGISLDFLLDTAANANTINEQVAQELQLKIVGQSLPGVGSSGYLVACDTYELGDAQLERASVVNFNEEKKENDSSDSHNEGAIEGNFMFIQNLTASALPVASPTGAGLLSLAFLQCFEGGVEFSWGPAPEPSFSSSSSSDAPPVLRNGMVVQDNPAYIAFYGEKPNQEILSDLKRVEIQPVPVTNLPSLKIGINGVDTIALLDTGSPITVLNQQAADLAGIETYQLSSQTKVKDKKSGPFKNPFFSMVDSFQQAREISQATFRGEVLTIAGTNGERVNLFKSKNEVHISMQASISADVELDDDTGVERNDVIEFGQRSVFVGEIPGLAALNGLGVDSPPAVVLGMDVLRSRPRMFLRVRENEVCF